MENHRSFCISMLPSKYVRGQTTTAAGVSGIYNEEKEEDALLAASLQYRLNGYLFIYLTTTKETPEYSCVIFAILHTRNMHEPCRKEE